MKTEDTRQMRRRKTEDRRQKTEVGSKGRSRFAGFILCSVFCLLTSSTLSAAPPSQNDVFKSIQDNVGHQTDLKSAPVILLVLGGALVMLLLAYFSRREQTAAAVVAVTLNHSGKLTKEVLKAVAIKPAELKQLKMLADSIEAETGESPDPLTLLLCPSLLAKGVKANPPRLDRKAVAQVVRRMRLNQLNDP